MELSLEEKKIIDRINKSYDDNTQYVEASAKDWNYIVHSIRKLHEEIKKEKSRIRELAELLDKKESEIKSLQQELEIQKGCSISKDEIREKIEHYNNELEHIKNGEEFENEEPMYYWGKVALENLLEEN